MPKVKCAVRQTENKFLNLYALTVEHRDGREGAYFVASRSKDTEGLKAVKPNDRVDGVAICAYYGEAMDRIVLVRQYRYPLGDYIYELPAGLLEPGEDVYTSATREIYEETGLTFVPKKVDPAYERGFFTTIGMSDECCGTVYGTCTGTPSNEHEEASEDIEVVLADRAEAARILKEEHVALICGYTLMHFISCEKDPLAFLREKL